MTIRRGLVALVGAVALVALLPGAYSSEEAPLRDVLLARETQLVEAIRDRDEPTIREMLSDEDYAVTPGGGRQTGAQMLQSLDNVALTTYSISDVEVVEASENVGVLTYRFTWAGTRGDQAVPATTVYATSIWAHREGEWKAVFYQETPVAE